MEPRDLVRRSEEHVPVDSDYKARTLGLIHAFPLVGFAPAQRGMRLRDWLAGTIAAGIAAGDVFTAEEKPGDATVRADMARHAVGIADALLSELQRTQTQSDAYLRAAFISASMEDVVQEEATGESAQ